MTKPTDQATTQIKEDAAKKKWLDVKMAAEKEDLKAQDLMPPQHTEGPPVDKKKDKDKSSPAEFYVLEKPKKKTKENEDEDKDDLKIAICWNGKCIPVDMSMDEAQDWCNGANQLLSSLDPEDRAAVEKAWDLLGKGLYDESRDELNKGLEAAKARNLELGPLPISKKDEDDEKKAAPKA